MRQGQQNRRGRGRNRKGQNPLTRSYESNGPDVKIRGTPAHVAEKYMSLARDAMASGDRVLAENHFQHAEHYNRIIMAYRDQQNAQAAENGRPRANSGHGDDANDDQADFNDSELNGSHDVMGANDPQPAVPGFEDQPQTDGHDGGGRNFANGEGRKSNGQRGRPGANGARRGRSGPGRAHADGHANGQSKGTNGASGSNDEQQPRRRKPAPQRFADSDDKPGFLSRSVRPAKSARASSKDAANDADSASAAADES